MSIRSSGQSRTGAFVEAWTNVLVGYGISVAANLMVMPAFGFRITVADAAGMGLVFTVISVVRSYCLRRWFNRA